jgi:hypothetical protein
VDLEKFTIAVYCLIDELVRELPTDADWGQVCTRGPAPILGDAEVLTMEVVGEFLGYHQYVGIVQSFRREHPDWIQALGRVHRTTLPLSKRCRNPRNHAGFWVRRHGQDG